MNSQVEQFDTLAALFAYPRYDYRQMLDKSLACTAGSAPSLLEFAHQVEGMPVSDLQELYTNTFDLQPLCPLDLGWHLFGEEYDRGLLLGYMRRQLRSHGVAEMGELPDHISLALRLLPRMKPAKAVEFASVIVVPALKRMQKCMPAENPFTGLLRAAQELMAAQFPAACEPVSPVAEGVMS